jgi:hypothetical protein
MELEQTQEALLPAYLASFDHLIGDQRTGVTLRETVKGIIQAGSLVCQRIASASTVLSKAKEGGQRVSRLARGESTKRSVINARSLTAALGERGITHLLGADSEELWVIADLSEVRKPYAREMPDLMYVRALDEQLVRGYRTVNVLGLTPQRRGILYHRLFTSQEEEFDSESLEIQQALRSVQRILSEHPGFGAVTWITDSGFDDIAVWRTVWEQDEHLLCRLKHADRLVEYRERHGGWVAGDIAHARQQMDWLATVQTEMVVRRGRQRRAKRQPLPAEVRACALRLTYDRNVRREGPEEKIQRQVWLVEVRLPGTHLEPWLLLTDWPVLDAPSAARIFQMYRQRWAVEDSFTFVKDVLGWEEVQLLHLEGIRTLLALGWVAAGFLYELGVTLEWEEVRLLARLGGWIPRPNNKPGKTVLTRGLRRLLDLLSTQAFLEHYRSEYGDLPPRIATILRTGQL